MTPRDRTIYYDRAVWGDATSVAPYTLQEAVSRCLAERPSVASTRCALGSREVEICNRKESPARLYLHIAAYTPGESASTVRHPSSSGSNHGLDQQAPPKDREYLDGNGMIVISGDHCLIMPSRLRKGTTAHYLRELLGNAGIPTSFQLLPTADPQAMALLERDGVRRIELNVSQFQATALRAEGSRPSLRRRLSKQLNLTLSDDLSPEQSKLLADVHSTLELRVSTRRGGTEILRPLVGPLAEEDAEGTTFVTAKGQRVKSGRLLHQKKVSVPPHGKTVEHVAAWAEMDQYLDELQRSGYLQL